MGKHIKGKEDKIIYHFYPIRKEYFSLFLNKVFQILNIPFWKSCLTPHSQKFYLQIGFPAESPFYGNAVIYQLNLRIQHNEIWISNIGAQTHQPQQELIPVLILTPPYMQVTPHGPGSGA